MFLPETEDQRLLRDSVARRLAAKPPASLADLATLGCLAAAVPEDEGGLGGRAADVVPVCTALGEAVAALPYVTRVLPPAALLCHVTDPAARAGLADALLAGEAIALAHQENERSFDACELPTARLNVEGRLTGTKRRVWHAAEASAFIVSALAPDGMVLVRVEPGTPGVALRPRHVASDLPWAEVAFEAASAVVVVDAADASAALEHVADFARVGMLAETLGLMRTAFEDTRAWLATRRQFGRTLAEQPVLQHRLVDMFIALEEAQSMLNLAAHAFDHAEANDRRETVATARVHVARSARFVGQSAVHLHGAMGITEELAVARAYRRIETLGALFGGVEDTLAQLAENLA
jgi:alkylation response protein AidB-like acyl-CoA dehydrogenase